MWVKQCHKILPHFSCFIPPIYISYGDLWDGLWHCFNHMSITIFNNQAAINQTSSTTYESWDDPPDEIPS